MKVVRTNRPGSHRFCWRLAIVSAIGTLCVSRLTGSLPADDWPQWMGPHRDNVWREDGVMRSFPDGGPEIVWRSRVAGGYAGPAVANGRVFVTDYVTADNVKVANFERNVFSGIERVHCLDQATGETLWSHEYPVQYTMSYPAGPRCTPLVDGDRLYTLGGEGQLICFRAADGDVIWQVNFLDEYDTTTALWGYASHPLIHGNQLICVVGGKGSHLVAFDKHSGEERWKALSAPEQGYSPPTIIRAAGREQLIALRPGAVSGIDPDSGKELWSVDYEADNGSVIMSPVRVGDYLYVAGYSNKNLLLKLDQSRPGATEVWRDLNRQAVSPINVQPIADGTTLFGIDQDGTFVAVDLPSGRRLWETPQPLSRRPLRTGTAFITRQGERYWLFTEQGDLVIAKLSREGFQELDRAHVIEPTNVAFGRDVVWSAPAYADRCVFLRNDQACICVRLAAR